MDKTQLIELPKILDERGNLTFIEEFRHIPFKIAQAEWIYDVPGGESRHGTRSNCCTFVVPISGSFEVELKSDESYALNRSNFGLFIPAGVWYRLKYFSTNSVALLLLSEPFLLKTNYEHD